MPNVRIGRIIVVAIDLVIHDPDAIHQIRRGCGGQFGNVKRPRRVNEAYCCRNILAPFVTYRQVVLHLLPVRTYVHGLVDSRKQNFTAHLGADLIGNTFNVGLRKGAGPYSYPMMVLPRRKRPLSAFEERDESVHKVGIRHAALR
jgi:hypothetical protein